jgi:hypothetical protein
MNKTSSRGSIIAFVTLLLTLLQPAYANGGHLHVEGIFFLLLGGVVFLGGLCIVFYFLLRPDPTETQDEHHDD